jgi:hypothetical protein
MMALMQVSMVVMSGLFFFYIDFYLCRDLTAAGKQTRLVCGGGADVCHADCRTPVLSALVRLRGKTAVYRLGA